MKNNKGFTLVEMAIVMLIVLLLFTLLLASIKKAKNAAKDARIQTSLNQMRTVIEHYFIKNETFRGFDSDPDYIVLKEDIENMNGGEEISKAVSDKAYCLYVKLNNNTFCCIDNNIIFKCYDSDNILKENCNESSRSYKCE